MSRALFGKDSPAVTSSEYPRRESGDCSSPAYPPRSHDSREYPRRESGDCSRPAYTRRPAAPPESPDGRDCVKRVPIFVPEGRCELSLSDFSPRNAFQSWHCVAAKQLSAGGTTEPVFYKPIRLSLNVVFTVSEVRGVAQVHPTSRRARKLGMRPAISRSTVQTCSFKSEYERPFLFVSSRLPPRKNTWNPCTGQSESERSYRCPPRSPAQKHLFVVSVRAVL